MVVSGNVSTVIGDTPVIIRILYGTTLISVGQIEVAQDGRFAKAFVTGDGVIWRNGGEYTVIATYLDDRVETIFSYSPEDDIVKNRTLYEVDAGEHHGTFDIYYSARGATVDWMVLRPNIFGLEIQIQSFDDGSITLELPREFIGAENQDGKDDVFIVLIDDDSAPYIEEQVHTDSRIVKIEFASGDSNIKIIGTYIVPEFGAVALAVLAIGTVAAIAAAKRTAITA